MKIAGKDFRQRAVAAYQSGEFTREAVAKMFGYTTTTIGNWMRTFKKEGRITPLPRGHRAPAFTVGEQQQLRERSKSTRLNSSHSVISYAVVC